MRANFFTYSLTFHIYFFSLFMKGKIVRKGFSASNIKDCFINMSIFMFDNVYQMKRVDFAENTIFLSLTISSYL